jgi:hypothetical protein
MFCVASSVLCLGCGNGIDLTNQNFENSWYGVRVLNGYASGTFYLEHQIFYLLSCSISCTPSASSSLCLSIPHALPSHNYFLIFKFLYVKYYISNNTTTQMFLQGTLSLSFLSSFPFLFQSISLSLTQQCCRCRQ